MLRRIREDFKDVMASSQRMQNQTLIGEQLLCRAKDKHTPKRALTEKLGLYGDCVILECTRDNNVRVAHQSVLEITSPIFVKRLHDRQNDPGRIRIAQLDLSVDVLDLMLQYFYTNQTINIPVHYAVQLLGAARKTIPAPSLIKQLENYFIDNIKKCLSDPGFLDSSMDSAEDVLSLAPVIDKMKLDRGTIITFIQRLSQWSGASKRNRAIGLLLIEKLTNIQNEQAAASVCNAVSVTRRFFLAIAVIICMVILRFSLHFN